MVQADSDPSPHPPYLAGAQKGGVQGIKGQEEKRKKTTWERLY